MDALNLLVDGFGAILNPTNLLLALLGVTLGTAIGVLPGIGPAMTVALLLPVTFAVEPLSAFVMFGGIYYGAAYGGSTTAILLNTPGEGAGVITALEGHKMALKGKAAQALATAAIGSFVAGAIATLALALLAPTVAEWAIKLGAADYFALMMVSFLTVSAALGSSFVRGVVALALGLGVALVGLDGQTGVERFSFGVPTLMQGIDPVTLAVGLMAIGETMWIASRFRVTPSTVIPMGAPWMGREDWSRSWKPWIRGTFIGFPFGAMPAGGAEVPTFLSYSLEKKLSKKPEEFGHGAIEGVAGPEATNNAAVAGVMVPLLTLGIPTSATAGVMLAAFQQYGIQPGPLLFTSNAELVWALIASLFVGNFMLLVLNLPMAPLWARLLQIPRPHLYAGITLFGALGTYAVSLSIPGLVVLLAIGMLGFAMRRFGLPIAPAIIGAILCPLAEEQFRRAMAIGEGDVSTLVSSPFAVAMWTVFALILLIPIIARRLASRTHPTRESDHQNV